MTQKRKRQDNAIKKTHEGGTKCQILSVFSVFSLEMRCFNESDNKFRLNQSNQKAFVKLMKSFNNVPQLSLFGYFKFLSQSSKRDYPIGNEPKFDQITQPDKSFKGERRGLVVSSKAFTSREPQLKLLRLHLFPFYNKNIRTQFTQCLISSGTYYIIPIQIMTGSLKIMDCDGDEELKNLFSQFY